MYSTVYILTKYKYVEILSKQINDFLSNSTNVIGGATILANDSGLAIRLLGNQFDRIKEIIFKVLDICRKNILNARFSGIRKNLNKKRLAVMNKKLKNFHATNIFFFYLLIFQNSTIFIFL